MQNQSIAFHRAWLRRRRVRLWKAPGPLPHRWVWHLISERVAACPTRGWGVRQQDGVVGRLPNWCKARDCETTCGPQLAARDLARLRYATRHLHVLYTLRMPWSKAAAAAVRQARYRAGRAQGAVLVSCRGRAHASRL